MLYVAIGCPSISSPGVTVEVLDYTFGSTAIVACPVGHSFTDGQSSMTIYCQSNGEWSVDVEALTCKSK